MNFASLMSKEISKGRDPPPSTASSEPIKKYLKRAEIEAQRQEAYLQEQAAAQRDREAKSLKRRERDEEEAIRNQERDVKRQRFAEESRIRREEEEAREERARRKRLGLPELPPPAQEGLDGQALPLDAVDIPDPELQARLRALSEPIALFAETHSQRLHRYTLLTTPLPPRPTLSNTPIPTTLALLPESSMKVPPTLPATPDARLLLFRQLASYFTMLLSEWSLALSARAPTVKESSQGIQALTTYTQTLAALRPLFRKFETGDLSDSLLEPVIEIVNAAQERRYVDANDGYLRLSIGKAAWPIGVTMVGIHERSAREKLGEGEKGMAHIMSDEGTRKWLQSVKRCLSFAQTRWPPEEVGQLMG